MFQAVVAGCILINFFIYDPLSYFLKKLAGAKNLLDLHAPGWGSDVRYTQECIKMKRSQSLQKGQPPPKVTPRLPVGTPGCIAVCPAPGLLPPLSHGHSEGPLKIPVGAGGLGDFGSPNWTAALPAEEACSFSGSPATRKGLPGQCHPPSLPSPSLSSRSAWCFVLYVLVSREGSLTR